LNAIRSALLSLPSTFFLDLAAGDYTAYNGQQYNDRYQARCKGNPFFLTELPISHILELTQL